MDNIKKEIHDKDVQIQSLRTKVCFNSFYTVVKKEIEEQICC